MDSHKKAPNAGCSQREGSDSQTSKFHDNGFIALRNSIWWQVQQWMPHGKRGALHGALIAKAGRQGFTPSMAREAIAVLTDGGFAEFGLDPDGRVVVLVAGQEGA